MQVFKKKNGVYAVSMAIVGATFMTACGGGGGEGIASGVVAGYVDPAKLDGQSLYASGDMASVSAQIVADSQTHVTGKLILKVGDLSFKDLNGNGIIDPYEDYRKSVNERTEDLLARMSVDQKVGLMAVDNGYMRAGTGPAAVCPTSTPMLGNRDLVCETGFALYGGLAVGVATSTLINEYNTRYIVTRDASPAPGTMARWSNQVQEIAEASALGIPVVIISNPRDHAAAGLGFSESSGNWPGTLGMAAAALGDKTANGQQDLIRNFAKLTVNEWVAGGMRKGYMYQADLATEPRWTRVNGTFGDDPDFVSEIQTQLIEGFQSPIKVSSGKITARMGVAMTTKHFPGNGIAPNGIDSHGKEGMYAVYSSPKSLGYHLKPFQSAVDAGTSAIMAYYQVPRNAGSVEQLPKDFWYSPTQQFEEVGAGFNDKLLAYLRKGMGFNGVINTDSRIMLDEGEPFGTETLTSIQREAKAINAGVNLVSVGTGEYRNGVFEAVAHKDIRAALDQGLVSIDQINDSTRRLLKEMFRLGLFEARYVDEAYATSVANADAAKALEAQHKSVVLLKNTGVLPLKNADAGVKIYAEGFAKGAAKSSLTTSLIAKLRAVYPNATFVNDYAQATVAFLMVTPTNTTLCSNASSPSYVACAEPPSPLASGLTRSHQEIGINDFTIDEGGLARIKTIQANTKSVMMINMGNPFLLDGIEPNASAVVATYDITVDALLDVIKGNFNPTGRLPMSIPAGQSALTKNASDLPGHYENFAYAYKDAQGSEYKFGFGLSYGK
ncbi:glycoside hydrolase family 3 N-terminal domain-containing protein [Variovorax sp. HJSM1_2]|uniref:glycoside hydrolase family 3 N-terminal domain-containing protein n=1 Tax=Variovorax sp. HJSM1_2 TaxID=3366263 RepID=UPI003BE684C2